MELDRFELLEAAVVHLVDPLRKNSEADVGKCHNRHR
jgi:hypothetical protein